MNEQNHSEELQLSEHFYGYLLTIFLAGLGLFLVSVEPYILRQFRVWISRETFNGYVLTWFAVSSIVFLLLFFSGIVIQFFRGRKRLVYYLWYGVILSASLFFATLFYQIWRGTTSLLALNIVILFLTNIVTLAAATLYYRLHFSQRHTFWPFVIGILAATTAYNWFYLSLIGKITL